MIQRCRSPARCAAAVIVVEDLSVAVSIMYLSEVTLGLIFELEVVMALLAPAA